MRFVNRKTIIPLIIIFALLFLIKNIVGSILSLDENSRILTDLKEDEKAAIRHNKFLKERLFYVQQDEFIEKEAREKLGMVKGNEQIVIIPPVTAISEAKKEAEKLPNWEKWRRLFF